MHTGAPTNGKGRMSNHQHCRLGPRPPAAAEHKTAEQLTAKTGNHRPNNGRWRQQTDNRPITRVGRLVYNNQNRQTYCRI